MNSESFQQIINRNKAPLTCQKQTVRSVSDVNIAMSVINVSYLVIWKMSKRGALIVLEGIDRTGKVIKRD